MKHRTAQIIREFGPFPGIDDIAGVSFDHERVWFASGDRLNALDPESGEITGSIATAADAGTAFDGTHLFQIADDAINKIDPKTGKVLATIPAPGDGGHSGLAWAEGFLWVGQHRGRRIHQVDPDSGESDIRHIDAATGDVLECLQMPSGSGVSGLESDGGDRFFCGSGGAGKLLVVRRPGSDLE
jgi:glutamine cyclotransferase